MRKRALRLISLAGLMVASWSWGGVAAAQDQITVIVNDVVAEPISDEAAYQVTAHVSVIDADQQPVTGLAADAFSASQDGGAVELESAAVTTQPASVVLAVDTSGSMGYQGKMDAVKQAATGFVDQLAEDDQAAVIYFNDQVVLGQEDLTSDFVAIKNVIGLLDAVPNAGTCLYDAIYAAIQLASKAPQGGRAIVLLTDGIDELPDQSGPCSQHTLDDVTALALDSATRVPIYTIGVGERVNAPELEELAESTGGDSLLSPDGTGVAGLFDTVAAQIKNQYELTYRSETTSGEHNLTVTVAAGSATGVGTRKFIAPQLPATLTLSGLDNNAILQGAQKVRATVSGDAELASVTFVLDGETLAEVTVSPFEVELDAADLAQGRHTLDVTAKLADGTELSEGLAFEVQAAVTGGGAPTGEGEAVGEVPTTGFLGLPIWVWPVALAAVAVVGLVAVVLARRRPRAQIVSGSAVTVGGAAGPAELTMDIARGDVFGTLTVQESLTLRKGQAFDLSGEVVTVGRGADSSVVIPDAPVSRSHAEIRREEGAFRVFDLGSTYGTFVNDKKVEAAGLPIQDGDTLRFGTRTVMTFALVWQPVVGPEDKTVDIGADTLAGLAAGGASADMDTGATIPADTAGRGMEDLGETIPSVIAEVGDSGETIPADMLIPPLSDRATKQGEEPLLDEHEEATLVAHPSHDATEHPDDETGPVDDETGPVDDATEYLDDGSETKPGRVEDDDATLR